MRKRPRTELEDGQQGSNEQPGLQGDLGGGGAGVQTGGERGAFHPLLMVGVNSRTPWMASRVRTVAGSAHSATLRWATKATWPSMLDGTTKEYLGVNVKLW